MPRTCTICSHEQREAIDAELLAGVPYRHIAARFGTSTGALQRHKAGCIPTSLVKATEAAAVAHGDDLLGQVRELQARAAGILDKAERCGDLKAAVAAIREARGCIELLGKLAGELNEAPVVNLVVMPEWVALRSRIVEALRPFPEARLAVAGVLDACR